MPLHPALRAVASLLLPLLLLACDTRSAEAPPSTRGASTTGSLSDTRDGAASCSSIAANGRCNEVEPSHLRGLNCGAAGARSESMPCPGAGRIASCLMQESRRAAHFYRGAADEVRRTCELAGGEFHAERVFPRTPE